MRGWSEVRKQIMYKGEIPGFWYGTVYFFRYCRVVHAILIWLQNASRDVVGPQKERGRRGGRLWAAMLVAVILLRKPLKIHLGRSTFDLLGRNRSFTASGLILLYCLDEEKDKYFKVQPNHVAPKGASYSKDGVRKRREKEEVSVFHEVSPCECKLRCLCFPLDVADD